MDPYAKMTAQIVPVTDDDVHEIASLQLRAAWKRAGQTAPDWETMRYWQRSFERYYNTSQNICGSYFQGLKINGNNGIAGCVFISKAYPPVPWKWLRVGSIESLCVDPDYQRHGLGRALLKVAMDNLRSKDCAHAYLYTEESNRIARSLYKGQGGQPVSNPPFYRGMKSILGDVPMVTYKFDFN